jgi:hypothetical protein
MTNETLRGRAQLRDTGPAQGIYEVDYILHINARTIKNIGQPPFLRRTVSADIRSVNGHALKNGSYQLEKNGEILYQLDKAGTDWQISTAPKSKMA